MDSTLCNKPDVLLLDLSDEISLEALADLRRRAPESRIVLWVRSISLELAYQTMRLGVHGILRKTLSAEVMLQCLGKVARGEYWFEEALSSRVEDAEVVSLSRRESQLVSLLAQGLKNKEIAYNLGISEGTIKVYLSKLYRKLGVKDRYELALYGLRHSAGAQLAAGEPARRGEAGHGRAAGRSPAVVLMDRPTGT